VVAGTYLERVISFDLTAFNWNFEFYQWFKWNPKQVNFTDLHKLHKGIITYPDIPIKLINGNIFEVQVVNYEINQDSSLAYVLYYIKGLSTQAFNTTSYPVDKHFLFLALEHSSLDMARLKFVPDLVSSKLSSRVVINGYLLDEPILSSSLHTYQSAYGDPMQHKDATKTFYQYRFGFQISHDGYAFYIKLFVVLLVSIFIAFLAFFAESNDQMRITLGALFTVAANNYVLTKNIPQTSTNSIAEIVNIISIVTIYIIICNLTILKYFIKKNKELTTYVHWGTFIIVFFFYVIINITIPLISI
jgi:hypothetical protein